MGNSVFNWSAKPRGNMSAGLHIKNAVRFFYNLKIGEVNYEKNICFIFYGIGFT